MTDEPAASVSPHDGREALSAGLLKVQARLLRLITGGTHISQVLSEFCGLIEESLPRLRCCVMLLSGTDNTLRLGAAPGLPAAFRNAIHGLDAALAPGSASTALQRDEIVVSPDIASDPIWEGLRGSALEHGLRACWSAPVRSLRWASAPDEEDEVQLLGTVDYYFDEPRRPTPEELEMLELTSALAGLAITAARTHEKVSQQQLYDPLTGLPNRRLFSEQLKESLAKMSPHDDRLAILRLDLDHFKEVNDSFGYAVGDFLLRSVAKRLIERRNATDIVARFGDDEFSFLIGELGRNEDVRPIAEEILSSVAVPHDFGGQHLAVTASLGASIYPWDGEDPQTLLRNAESALNTAKRLGRNRYRLYAPTMGVSGFEKLQLKMSLGYAAENGELELLYQPKLRSDNQEITGAEALVYWNHPSQGRLSPGKFIPLAEETGIILPLGEWVLSTACEQVKSWRSSGYSHLTIAVNISALQFRERSFKDTVASILRRSGLEPEALELEITETVAMTEVDKTMERLEDLQTLGLRISIDDFGTGYSSLAYLKRFPIHTLKIDRSFVRDLPQSKENKAIVKAVIAMSRYMNLSLVAEGVETEEQARFLAAEGCGLFQGHYFSHPVSAAAFEGLLRDGRDAASGRCFLLAGEPAGS